MTSSNTDGGMAARGPNGSSQDDDDFLNKQQWRVESVKVGDARLVAQCGIHEHRQSSSPSTMPFCILDL
jgi:hypothetical protein